MLPKTFELLREWRAGGTSPVPSFDAAEVELLGAALRRLLYSPPELRARLQELGVTITPANFYSEIPLIADIERSFENGLPSSYSACFQVDQMTIFLDRLSRHNEEFDPPVETPEIGVFSWKGGPFSYSDAMSYYCFVREKRPRTIIEIGSGWSTLVADLALKRNGSGRIICIEPFPNEFLGGIQNVEEVIKDSVQRISSEFFNSNLQDGDIVFIDSTHTVKHDSDCLHIYLRVLPELRARLFIHAHDIYLPHPLPLRAMRDRQIYWTEQYLLYAYLLENPRTNTLYSSVWHSLHNKAKLEEFMRERFPPGGASFWFEQSAKLS